MFVLPMIWFHRLMARRRTELLPEADELSGRCARAAGTATAADATSQARYAMIETMPTWPVDDRIRRRFGLGNVLLVLPVLAQILDASQGTQELLDQLSKVISGRA